MKPTGQMDMQTCVYARLTNVYLINVFFSPSPRLSIQIHVDPKTASFRRARLLNCGPRCAQRILIEFPQRYTSSALCQQCIKLTINKFKLDIAVSFAISQVKGNKIQKHVTFGGFRSLNSSWKAFSAAPAAGDVYLLQW